jgi:putative acetyltransferase
LLLCQDLPLREGRVDPESCHEHEDTFHFVHLSIPSFHIIDGTRGTDVLNVEECTGISRRERKFEGAAKNSKNNSRKTRVEANMWFPADALLSQSFPFPRIVMLIASVTTAACLAQTSKNIMTTPSNKDNRNYKVSVRELAPGDTDIPALEELYRAAFPDEDLLSLVHQLHEESPDVVCSLVATESEEEEEKEEEAPGGRIVGSIFFTACTVVVAAQDQRGGTAPAAATTTTTTNSCVAADGGDDDEVVVEEVALLGPLCVSPSRQGRGYGSLLVREGIRRMTAAGRRTKRILVLGSPNYYGRFGFRVDDGHRIQAPYPMPEKYRRAWQSLTLQPSSGGGGGGGRGGPEHDNSLGAGTLVVPKPWRNESLWTGG